MTNQTMTFDNFLEDPVNPFAAAVCQAVAQDPGGLYNPLWLFGPHGCGKSHLLSALHLSLSAQESISVCCVDAADVTDALLKSLESQPSDWDRYAACDVLLVDNGDVLIGKDSTQSAIAKLIVKKCHRQQQVVLVSSVEASAMSILCDTLRAQTSHALFAHVPMPNEEMRRRLIARYMEAYPFPITKNALNHIISLPLSVAQLQGFLTAATFWHQVTGRKVTMWWVKNHTNDI